jgi:hypothetical protein
MLAEAAELVLEQTVLQEVLEVVATQELLPILLAAMQLQLTEAAGEGAVVFPQAETVVREVLEL